MAMEDETWDKVNDIFSKANVFTFSKNYESKQQLDELITFLTGPLSSNRLEGKACRKGTLPLFAIH